MREGIILLLPKKNVSYRLENEVYLREIRVRDTAAVAMRTLFIALRATLFATGFFFLWRWVALSLHDRYDSAFSFAVPGWARAGGIALMFIGGAVALACVATFITRGEGTPAPFDPPRKFVADGPYKFVRNPMYIGGFIVLLGFGLFEQSPAIIVFALPWLLLAHLFVILYEEPHLRATFGAGYDAYCHSVPRWLPRRHAPKD